MDTTRATDIKPTELDLSVIDSPSARVETVLLEETPSELDHVTEIAKDKDTPVVKVVELSPPDLMAINEDNHFAEPLHPPLAVFVESPIVEIAHEHSTIPIQSEEPSLKEEPTSAIFESTEATSEPGGRALEGLMLFNQR